MQLFSRSVQTSGAIADVMAYAIEMRQYVADKIGREIALWSTAFGGPVGSVAYTMRVDGLADLESATAGLETDEEYHAKLAGGQAITVGVADALLQPVHGELGDHPPVGSYASVTQATMAPGKYGEAAAFGVEICKHVESISDVPLMFLTSDYGTMGAVAWIAVVPDAAAVDASFATIRSDAAYMKMVNDAGDLFLPGSGHRSLSTRIA